MMTTIKEQETEASHVSVHVQVTKFGPISWKKEPEGCEHPMDRSVGTSSASKHVGAGYCTTAPTFP